MKRVKLFENSEGRFETFFKGEHYSTLTCGNRLYLFDEDDVLCPGRVEHNNYGYYWICDDGLQIEYLRNGIYGYVE